MNGNSSKRLLLPLALALVSLALFVGPVAAVEPAPEKSAAKFEIKFMTDMIDHHAMAVHMAEMCLEMAVDPELEAMCQDIITTQSQEIEMMQSLLLDWYGLSYEPMMHMNPGMMNRMEKMDSMTPEEFEVHFMEEMTKHHTQAIKEAEMALKKAYHPELTAMAEDIITSQSAEIEQMEEWLCEWYDLCKK